MRAMVLEKPAQRLQLRDLAKPKPGRGQLLVRISACAVCRTDLHVVDGELPDPKLPLILGHQIVGRVEEVGEPTNFKSEISNQKFAIGDRVGIPWLGWTDGDCAYCRSNRENLCDNARFTGYTLDGGYAEYTLADQRFCFPIPERYGNPEAAPLLCAGLIGYRSLVKAGNGERLGIYGFGAAAHIIAQVANYQQRAIYAFARPGDNEAMKFALSLGAVWSGGSNELPPDRLDAAIIFAPVGGLVPQALSAVRKGGTVVCAGIHMTDIPSFPYSILWEERSLCSVANLTRRDGEEFLSVAPRVPVKTVVQPFPLEAANEALSRLRSGNIQGAAVLVMDAKASG